VKATAIFAIVVVFTSDLPVANNIIIETFDQYVDYFEVQASE
jgi:hypothetical protein